MRFAPLGFGLPELDQPLQRAVSGGVIAAGAIDGRGTLLAVAGLDAERLRATAAAAIDQIAKSDDRTRMMAGEQVTAMLDDQAVTVAIVEQCVFVIAIQGPDVDRSGIATSALRHDVERMIREVKTRGFAPPSGSGGSSSGPAELPLIELPN